MSRTRSITDKQIAEVIRMKKDGLLHKEISEKTGVPVTSISRILRQNGLGHKKVGRNMSEQQQKVACHLEMFINEINAVLC